MEDFSSFFAEYDECSNPHEHGCEHECFNTLGGYSCQCRIGYELHSDEKRCESKSVLPTVIKFAVLFGFNFAN